MNMPTWISTDSAVWFSFLYTVAAGLLSMVRSDNPFPINFSARGKAILVSVLVLAQAVLHAKVSGVPWIQALILAVTSGGLAFSAHGFRNQPIIQSGASTMNPTIPSVPPAVQSLKRYIPESGLARVTLVLGMVLCGLTALCAVLASCTPAETAIEKQIANCILARFATDTVAGMTPAAAAIDTAAYCATTELAVNTTVQQAKADMLARHNAISDAGSDH